MEPNAENPETTAIAAKAEKTEKAQKKAKRRFARPRLTISSLLLGTVLAAILLAGGLAGLYALSVVYQNKLTDTWAILFLELESQGNHLTQTFEQFRGRPGSDDMPPDVILKVNQSGRFEKIRGDFPDTLTPSDLSLASAKLGSKWTVLQFAGDHYLTLGSGGAGLMRWLGEGVTTGSYFLMWKIDLSKWLGEAVKSPERNTLYLLTKEGRLIFSNDPEITQTNYIQRKLIQQFISAPLNQGQLEFEAEQGDAYGFFYEVPTTNIVMFVETLKSVAMAPVRSLAVHFSIVLLFLIGGVGLLLQFPLTSLIAPMKELVRLAAEIGDGNFQIKPRMEGFGELKVLTQSFSEMAKNLLSRDEKINGLLVEQQEKFRLANELSIAHSIQENFLLKAVLPEDAGLEIAAEYVPATEVAGDWYGYFFNDATGEAVIAIADVSGHGAGSAMFTAIIAATFEETRARSAGLDAFPMEDFMRRLNRLFMKLGKGTIHATMLMARYRRDKNEVEFLNAGHPFPILYPPPGTGAAEPVNLRSDLLGLSLDFFPVAKTVSLPPGASILMYTDGLIEGSPDKRLFSEKRLIRIGRDNPPSSPSALVERVREEWTEHLKGQTAADDLCLLALKAAA
jgi:serine phosphatase RsbU (regulator of sigma subunit)